MKMIDVLNEAKAKNASKVFINPAESKTLVDSLLEFPTFPVALEDLIEMKAIGKGHGINWYEDPSLEPGTFRIV